MGYPEYEPLRCAPYSMAAVPVIAKIRAYSIGGWGRKEWDFVASLPSRAPPALYNTAKVLAYRRWQATKEWIDRNSWKKKAVKCLDEEDGEDLH